MRLMVGRCCGMVGWGMVDYWGIGWGMVGWGMVDYWGIGWGMMNWGMMDDLGMVDSMVGNNWGSMNCMMNRSSMMD